MTDEPYGDDALAAYNRAMALVKDGKYDEARAVPVYHSDRIVIEKAIQREQQKVRK